MRLNFPSLNSGFRSPQFRSFSPFRHKLNLIFLFLLSLSAHFLLIFPYSSRSLSISVSRFFCPILDSFVVSEEIPIEFLLFHASSYNCQSLTQTPNSPRVVLSLTTFPARIEDVAATIYSLMVQTFRPDAIVLYLSEREFKGVQLPQTLLRLTEYGLTIRFVPDDIRQYLKLIPAMREFPDALIVTYDDDVFYPSDSLAVLIESYRQNPKIVHTNRARLVPVNGKGDLMIPSVYYWKIYCCGERPSDPSPLVFPEGVSGTLYPPGVLHSDATNATLFLDLAPTHDDLWFWAMAVANGRMATLVHNYRGAMNITGKKATKRLCDVNIGARQDRRQNRRVFAQYIGQSLAEERQRRSSWYGQPEIVRRKIVRRKKK
jgi:hypothetical protein